MLTIFGKPNRNGGFCDGVTRRDFLTIGGTVLGGALALPRLLAAEARSGIKSSHRAVINVFLPGGPPHIDMWDLKPDAPAEIRGEFKPIKTNLSIILAISGKCSPMSMPGTLVLIGLNSPRISAGASGFRSHMSM